MIFENNTFEIKGIKKLINDAGFEATQRTTEYDLIEEMSKAT